MAPDRRRSIGFVPRAAALAALVAAAALSAALAAAPEPLALAREFFPAATRVGGFDGAPPAAPVLAGQRLLGYVFFTDQVAPIPAYSGQPIRTLVALDRDGRIAGVRIVAHEEPILVLGLSDADLQRFVDQYAGVRAGARLKIGGQPREGYVTLDGISGATITMMVLNRSIGLAVARVAEAVGLLGEGSAAQHDPVLDPTWAYAWREKRVEIVILLIGLAVLLTMLVFQDFLARRPRQVRWLRDGFLVFTLVFIGWYGLAQLSIINVLTFLHSIAAGFQWDTFLIEPLIFILWGFVAVTIILWGRGVYCGWLCPFGALQEITFRVAKRLGVPSWEPPEVVHERLQALKYIAAIILFGVSLGSLSGAVRLAEIEPFKTAITLRFERDWPYLAWAGALLLAGLFVRRFFCRYLCPLGAALTFPGRFALFDWLRRRRECGHPCQICAVECPVRAIKATGAIVQHECHYCLDCQVTYWNAHKCPPLVEKRKRRERRERLGGDAGGGADHLAGAPEHGRSADAAPAAGEQRARS